MGLQLAALSPVIGPVVMRGVAQQQAVLAAVDDDPDVGAHPQGPKVLVAGLVELMELESRVGRVHLEIKRGRLHLLLLVTGEPGEARSERVRDSELHAR